MMKMVKNVMAVGLTCGLFLSEISGVPAAAAGNTALQVPISFTGQNWEQEWWNGSKTMTWTGTTKEISLEGGNLTMGYQVAFPKTVFQKSGDQESVVQIGANLDVTLYEEFAGTIERQMDIQIAKVSDGKYRTIYYDEAAQSDKDASAYAMAKQSGDYVIVTVKNYPLKNVCMYNDEERKLDGYTECYVTAFIDIGGINIKTKATAYIDDVTVSRDGKELVKVDYSSDKDYSWIAYNMNNTKEMDASVAEFSNQLLTLAKKSATIKVGKKVTIKAAAAQSAKITYRSSKPKVASVNAKGVVKGLKAGKAKITVSANGVSRTFTVTVKKK